jgi:hypothetical protein
MEAERLVSELNEWYCRKQKEALLNYQKIMKSILKAKKWKVS